MPLEYLVDTEHFTFRYDGAISYAKAAAQAIADTCEAELATLGTSMPFASGPGGDPFVDDKRIIVWLVDVTTQLFSGAPAPPGRGGAWNNGRRPPGTPGHSLIMINTTAAPGYPITDDFARFLFIAELSELLMSSYGWKPAASTGEALSRVFAEEFHPASTATFVNGWLNSPARANFIDGVNESTDRDGIAFGCAILFINYLRSQLGYTLAAICQDPGPTLADRYKKLTGRTDDGFVAMTDLLNRHFDKTKPIALLTNNPFPLYEG